MSEPAGAISDAEVFERLPGARIDRDNIAFFRGLLERRLLINRCAECGHWHSPPWPICPRCWSADVQATEVSGAGTIHSFTIRRGGGQGYPVAVVELAEQAGLRVTATVVDCTLEEIADGMPVRLTWTERDGEPLPAFAARRVDG